MIAAVAATGIWSLSVLASARGARHLGGISANLVRLGVALPLLCLAAAAMGLAPWQAAAAPGAAWFILAGVVGMGVCDILVLEAYPRLGARMTALLINTLAALVAAAVGWVWLRELPTLPQAGAILAVLAGVALVLRPRQGDRVDRIGLLCAVLGATAFGLSAVFSRYGFAEAQAAAQPMHWLDSTVLRVAAGLGLTLVSFAAASVLAPAWRDGPGRWRQAVPWLALNATMGPGLGLACYQWALTSASAAEVHAVVAVVPITVLVATWVSGDERPDATSIAGTVIAVAGVVALLLAR